MDKPADEHLEIRASAVERDAETIAAPEGYRYVAIDPAVERSLVRKLDRALMPLLFVSYLLAFLDRSNIGNAQTAGMGEALGMSDSQYQWLLTIFYIPYIVFEWTAVMWKIVPPHRWAAVAVLIWGIAATLQATAFNWSGLMVCRFFLATAEAGWGPGVPYLLSFFYRRHELGARCGIFLSAAPLATTFAGALAYGITSGHSQLANWRLLFLVEGLPTLIMAVVIFFYLPDSPDTARFLTPEEREVAAARGILQTGKEGRDRIGGINLSEVLSTFKEPQTLILPLMYFSCNVSFSSLPVFLPTILTTMGYSKIHAQGLTAPPYFLSFLVCIGTTFLADRLRQRGLIIAVLSVIGGIGYILLATVEHVAVRYLGVFLAAAGVFPAISNILPWVTNNQATDTKRGVGIAMLNIIGQCGPILGTRIFPNSGKPYFVKGMSICAGFMFFNALLSIILRQYLAYKNKQFELAEAEQAAAASAVGEASEPEKGTWSPTGPEMQGTFGYRYIL